MIEGNEYAERSIGREKTLTSTSGLGGGSCPLGRIDQYELLKELGGGGFGTVFLAKDTTSGIEVAVKGLPPLLRNNKEEMENVRRNFALVSRLHHPNIAAALVLHPVREVHVDDRQVLEKLSIAEGDTLMVMEYAPGVTLSQWRKQFPDWKVPVDVALDVAGQLASALDYAHERSIIHRDIKPSNIMVETQLDGRKIVRVLDFGLAAEIRSSISKVSMDVRDTSGTRPYMAPEQWLGQRQGAATDQYSLAVVICEMLTGEVPFASVFDTGDPIVMMNAVGHEQPDIADDLPGSIRRVLLRAFSKHGDERFETCGDLVAALGGEGKSVSRKAASSRKVAKLRKGNDSGHRSSSVLKWLLGSAAAVAVVVGGVFGYKVMKDEHERLASEVYLLEAKAGQAREKNASAEWRSVEFFRERSKELEGFYRAGHQASERGELKAARDSFLKVRDTWYWLSTNFSHRAEALVVKGKAEALRVRSEALKTEIEDADGLKGAISALNAAELNMKDGAFLEAAADYARAVEQFEPIISRAEKVLRTKNIKASRIAYDANRYEEAYRLSLAADQDNPSVNFQLGWLTEKGYGGAKKDAVKALEYYRKAEAKGSAAAIRNIGLFYEFGNGGLAKDLKIAAEYYQRAVDGGDNLSCQCLGDMYEFGKGVSRDLDKAKSLYDKAVEGGCESAQKPLDRVKGKIAKAETTKKAVAAFRDRRWDEGFRLAKDADREDSDIQFFLGVCYGFGYAVAVDKVESAKWYRKSAEQGDVVAMNNLGCCYRGGLGVTKDYAEAMKWLRKSLDGGYAPPLAIIGLMYENGQGVEKDVAKAIEYYRRGAEKEDGLSMRCLGVLYDAGKGVTQDYAEAASLYRRAMEKGDDTAKAFLAEMYEKGKGVAKDLETAKRLYREAATQKIDYAIKALARLESDIDVSSPEAMRRQQEGQTMLGIDIESPFRNGPVIDVEPGTDLAQFENGMQSGTTLRLKAGTYELSGIIRAYHKDFRIIGVSPDETIIKGSSRLGPNWSNFVLQNVTLDISDEWALWGEPAELNKPCRRFTAVINCVFKRGALRVNDGARLLVCRTVFEGGGNSSEWLLNTSAKGYAYLSDVVTRNAKKHALIAFDSARVVAKNCRFSNKEGGTDDVVRMNGSNCMLYIEGSTIAQGGMGLYVGSAGSYSIKNVKFSKLSKFGIGGMYDMPVVDLYGCKFTECATRYEKTENIRERTTEFVVNTEMLK